MSAVQIPFTPSLDILNNFSMQLEEIIGQSLLLFSVVERPSEPNVSKRRRPLEQGRKRLSILLSCKLFKIFFLLKRNSNVLMEDNLPDGKNSTRRRESTANHFFIADSNSSWVCLGFQEIPETDQAVVGYCGRLTPAASISHASNP